MAESLVGHIPDDWNVTTLGGLCISGGGGIQTGPFGSQLHASDYVTTGIPSVMPQNIGDNAIVEDGIARVTETDAQRLSRYLLKAGDIVYSRRGDVERRAFVRFKEDGWLCGTGCLRVRVGNAANARFVSYYLGHPAVRDWIVRHAIGATMPNLNTAILSAVPVVLPSEPEQVEIAALLEALDDKIAANRLLAGTALQLARAHYLSAASRGKWREVTLGEVALVLMGQSPPGAFCNRRGEGSPLLNGPTEFGSHSPKASQWTMAPTRICTKGDLLLCVRGSAGRVNWADREYVIGRGLAAIRARRSMRHTILVYFSLVERMSELLAAADGSIFPNLARAAIESFPITWPDNATADVTVELLNSLVDQASIRENENTALTELRDTLLPRLMSGEIRVRDAEKVVEEVL